MERLPLKNKANRTKCLKDYQNYKKKRNIVVNLNKKAKRIFFW